MSFLVHYDLEKGSLNKYLQSTLGREGGGHKKEYAVYVFYNVDNKLSWMIPNGPGTLVCLGDHW